MRNYFKTRALRLYPITPPDPIDPLNFYVVFGGTDDDLLYYQQKLIALIGGEFAFGEPQICWFELDLKNFSMLLNCGAGNIWSQTRLNDVFPVDPDLPLLWDMTRVEVQGSPRPTWSNGE